MTSALVTFRNAILTRLDADERLDGVHVYAHGGDFDLQELRDFARQTPAVVLALTNVDMENHGGIPMADVMCTLMVVTSDKPANPRDLRALTIVDAVCQILTRFPNQDWGLEIVAAPRDVKAINAYSKKVNADGVALWAVAWRQRVELTEFPDLVVTDALEQFHANYDLYPRDNDAPIATASDPQPAGSVIEAEDDVDLT